MFFHSKLNSLKTVNHTNKIIKKEEIEVEDYNCEIHAQDKNLLIQRIAISKVEWDKQRGMPCMHIALHAVKVGKTIPLFCFHPIPHYQSGILLNSASALRS